MLSSSTAGSSEDLAAARERAFAGEDAAQRATTEAAQLRAKLANLEQVGRQALMLHAAFLPMGAL